MFLPVQNIEWRGYIEAVICARIIVANREGVEGEGKILWCSWWSVVKGS